MPLVAINSAGECYLHMVEVTVSNPVLHTNQNLKRTPFAGMCFRFFFLSSCHFARASCHFDRASCHFARASCHFARASCHFDRSEHSERSGEILFIRFLDCTRNDNSTASIRFARTCTRLSQNKALPYFSRRFAFSAVLFTVASTVYKCRFYFTILSFRPSILSFRP